MKRGSPMKRTGFKPKWPEKAVTVRAPSPSIQPDTSRFKAMQRVSGEVVAYPKEQVKAKPGKRPPTVSERAWMDSIVEFGCVACWLDGQPSRPCAVHHLLRGGQRIGHLHTIGLCDPGHHQGGQPLGLISRHPDKARFEAKYGTEAELLALLQARINKGAIA